MFVVIVLLQVTCYPTAVRVPASAGAVVYAACGRRHSALLTGAASSAITASTASAAAAATTATSSSDTAGQHAAFAGNSSPSSGSGGGLVLTFGCGLRGQLGNGCTTDILTVPTVVRSLEGVGALQPGSSQGGITCKCCNLHVLMLFTIVLFCECKGVLFVLACLAQSVLACDTLADTLYVTHKALLRSGGSQSNVVGAKYSDSRALTR
jgi:Regulator of chromosome condensation (RCC1) repeat